MSINYKKINSAIKKASTNHRTILPKDLGTAMEQALMEYHQQLTDDMIDKIHDISLEAKAELKQARPPGDVTGSYRRGWAVKDQRKGKLRHTRIIWNRTDYRLTHLLEFGHRLVSKNGTVYGHVKAFPHIRPVEDKYQDKFFTELVEEIQVK